MASALLCLPAKGGNLRMYFLRIGLICAALVMGGSWSAGATTWLVPEPEELLADADAIVLARVDSIRSVASFDGSSIDTEIELQVIEGYKGAVAGERILVREAGGQVGENILFTNIDIIVYQ